MNFKYPVLAHLSWNITMIMIPSGSMETRCHCQYIFCPDGSVVWVKISNKCPTWLWANIWISISLQNSSILIHISISIHPSIGSCWPIPTYFIPRHPIIPRLSPEHGRFQSLQILQYPLCRRWSRSRPHRTPCPAMWKTFWRSGCCLGPSGRIKWKLGLM